MSTTLAPTAPTVICEGCGESVRAVFTVDQRRVQLDPEMVAGGLYVIDAQHRARRRSLVELYRAQQSDAVTAGLNPHECTRVAWFAR